MIISVGEVWSDLDGRFIQDSEGALKKAVNIDAVLVSIDNILRTYKGERCMLPQFASDLHGLLFSRLNQTVVKYVSRNIKDTIEMWEPRVLINDVVLEKDPDGNSLSIGLSVVIKGHDKIFRYQTSIKSGE